MQNACGQRSVTPAAPLYMKKVEMIIMPEIPKSDLHPSWVPEDANENFACSVMGGIDTKVNANSEEKKKSMIPMQSAGFRCAGNPLLTRL